MATVPRIRKQVLAVIDPATTMVCLDCAGQVRDIDEDFRTLAGDFPRPPFHRWCRSVVIPHIPGVVDTQRAAANREIRRRPIGQRRRGTGGVGARIPPPPHAATFERRSDPTGIAGYGDLFDRITSDTSSGERRAVNRYLASGGLDRRLRTGDLTSGDLTLVGELDRVVARSPLPEDVTVFTPLPTVIAGSLRAGDVVSDDAYLLAFLDPAVSARYGHPVAVTLPAGLPAVGADRETGMLLGARRHSWRLLALGAILVAMLL